jgi:hypothetical protein
VIPEEHPKSTENEVNHHTRDNETYSEPHDGTNAEITILVGGKR